MSRARMTVRGLDRLIGGGESADTGISHVTPSPHSLVKPTVFSQPSTSPKTHKTSSFHHRIFSRSSAIREDENDPSQRTQSLQHAFSEPTPRKTTTMMTGWPFSRRCSRPTEDADANVATTASDSTSPYYSVTSCPASTSSLGSLVPTHECLFHVISRDSPDAPANTPSSTPIVCNNDTGGCGVRGNHEMVVQHLHQNQASGVSEPTVWTSSLELGTEDGTCSRSTIASSERRMSNEDPTPHAEAFNQMILPAAAVTQKRVRRVPPPPVDFLALRPAVGVAPHAPSETESFSTSACSASASSPPVSPVTRDSFPAAFPAMKASDTNSGKSSSPPQVSPSASLPNSCVPAVSAGNGSLRLNPSSDCGQDAVTMASSVSAIASPRPRKRAISRSLTPPPLPRPPPKGPLPAVPSSSPPVPPVPPLPPLLNKLSAMNVNVSPHTMIPSPPRSSTMTGAPATPANAGTTALPPSPPGALRLPSRLSWVHSVRVVLPSPPASPTKKAKTLNGNSKPSSSFKAEKKRSNELERRPRPVSVGVIEAVQGINNDNHDDRVRRTKSILLLGSRSKSNVSFGTKRVQIHADANMDSDAGGDGDGVGAPLASTASDHVPVPVPTPLRKQKYMSNSTTALGLGLKGRPTSFPPSDLHPRVPSLPVPIPTREEVTVFPLERRHSAPLLSTLGSKIVPSTLSGTPSSDWTLSLPFCTDVPGNKILLSSPSAPQLKSPSDEKEEEDWTLCMPLKLRAVDVPIHKLCEGDSEEGTSIDKSEALTTEADEAEAGMTQLPTPSPSPTWSTPRSGVVPLDPVEDEEQGNEDKGEAEQKEEEGISSVVELDARPASPASTLGPHIGGLDLAGGRGKRASGWHVYGWFDEVRADADIVDSNVAAVSESKLSKTHVSAFREKNDASSGARHPSQDSILSATSTPDTVFYSARSSLLSTLSGV